MTSSGGAPGSSPSSNPSPSPPFDVQKLFKPPSPSSNPNPNPIPRGASPFLPPPSSYPSPLLPSTSPSAPLSALTYPPSTSPFQHRPFLHYPQAPSPIPITNPNPNPNAGARLMALLGTSQPSNLESAISVPSPTSPLEFSVAPGNHPILHPPPQAMLQPDPARLPSSKLPRGRRLAAGDRAVYDVDLKLPGESQPPQLEVTPITKYISDPGLVLGRQIALNRVYICYGLKLGAIRVLNINTALRSLLRGHTQKVSDMAFFAEDVPLLASASIDGRIFVWKINEVDEDNKPQITGKIVLAIQIVGAGEGEPYHPRVCWHPHKQEVLVVGVGNYLLKIDTIKVGRIGHFSAEEPVRCPIDNPIDGVQHIGKHDGEITDISMSQWMTTRLASAAKDGKIKIWEDRKAMPIATLTPHDNQPVSSVAFMTSPERPDHIILVSAGPLNRELKIWVSASEEGWLLPSDSESWKCNQTLDLRSSTEPRLEEAFFNQFVVQSRASFILLANAKKNAIYALHVDYGPNPASTRMDYIADFTVTMPILSFTGTCDWFSDAEQIVQVYCVQTQAIQQYALDLSQCLPILVENEGSEKHTTTSAFDGSISEGFSVPHSSSGATSYDAPLANSSPKPILINRPEDIKHQAVSGTSEATVVNEHVNSNAEPALSAQLSSVDKSTGDVAPSSPSLPLNLDLSEKLHVVQGVSVAGEHGNLLKTASVGSQGYDSMLDRTLDAAVTNVPDVPLAVETSGKEKTKAVIDANSMVPNIHPLVKPDGIPTHLVTPSEILLGAMPPAESSVPNLGHRNEELDVQKVSDKNGLSHVEGKVLGDRDLINHDYLHSENEPKEALAEQGKLVKHPSEPIHFLERKTFRTEERDADRIHTLDSTVSGKLDVPSGLDKEVAEETIQKVAPSKDSSTVGKNSQPISDLKSNKPKENLSQVPASLSPISSPFASDSLVEHGPSIGNHSTDVLSQLRLMQDLLNQLATNQKEMEKQMAEVVCAPVIKEGRRLEAALGRNMEKSIKANLDSLWAHIQEENAKQEKTERENMQQLTSLITNCVNKDIPSVVERTIKKEISAVGQVLARTITPAIEKCISSAIADSFQRGVTDKTVSQLEKTIGSKLDASLARQIQSQFQTSGRHTMQDTLKSTLESSVVPAFEKSCRGLFEQIDETFQKGLTDQMSVAQQQYESAHTQLALTLRDSINSASSITQNLVSELADGQQKLLALFSAGNTKANPIAMQQSNGQLGGHLDMALSVQQIEAPVDPTKELTRLISERKFDEAFTLALQRSDVSIVSWLCSQVDLHGLCSVAPLPLSQGVLLALLQQISCDIGTETQLKISWMTDVAVSINPTDPMITSHVRPIFEQVYNRLLHQRTLQTTTVVDASSFRLIIHVINSVLMSCK